MNKIEIFVVIYKCFTVMLSIISAITCVGSFLYILTINWLKGFWYLKLINTDILLKQQDFSKKLSVKGPRYIDLTISINLYWLLMEELPVLF